jgi:hypothetical protein
MRDKSPPCLSPSLHIYTITVVHYYLAPEEESIRHLLLLGSNKREEHVEGNLDTVDKDKTMLVGDELEVDGVHNGPHLPGSFACW